MRTLFVVLPALGLAILAGMAYAWAGARGSWLIGLLTVWLFAICLAFIVKAACMLARIRNVGMMMEFGIVLGCVAWASHWVFWIVFATYDSIAGMPGGSLWIPLADMFSDPLAPFSALGVALEASGWGEDVDADIVRIFGWILEFCVLFAAASTAGAAQAEKPFCETSQRWAKRVRLPYRFAADPVYGARVHLVQHPDQLLAALSPAKSASQHAEVRLYLASDAAYLSIDVVATTAAGSRFGTRKEKVLKYVRIPRQAADAFQERAARRMSRATRFKKSFTERLLICLDELFDAGAKPGVVNAAVADSKPGKRGRAG